MGKHSLSTRPRKRTRAPLAKVSWRNVLAHKVRLLLTVLAVVLGTAFIAGSSILTAGLSNTFDQMATSRYADVDLVMGSTMGLTLSLIHI